MKLGLSSYTLPWAVGIPGYGLPKEQVTVVSLLKQAHANGIRLVQIADNLPLHTLSVAELDAINQTADRFRIDMEIGTRGTSIDHLLTYLDLAKSIKSKLVRTIITTTDMVEAERNLKEVLPRYTKEDIVIAIENHGLHTTEQLVTLFKNIDSPYLGSCLDTVNSFGALENPDKVIMNLVPYIKNLHIKDFEIKRHRHQLGFEIIGTPAGKGHLNLDLLFDTINKSGNNPTAILELWTPYTDTLEETVAIEQLWLRESLDFLKSCPEISL